MINLLLLISFITATESELLNNTNTDKAHKLGWAGWSSHLMFHRAKERKIFNGGEIWAAVLEGDQFS